MKLAELVGDQTSLSLRDEAGVTYRLESRWDEVSLTRGDQTLSGIKVGTSEGSAIFLDTTNGQFYVLQNSDSNRWIPVQLSL